VIEALFACSTLGLARGLTRKHLARLENLTKSLRIADVFFIKFTPRVNVIKLLLSVIYKCS
jgi:hypothetical protein